MNAIACEATEHSGLLLCFLLIAVFFSQGACLGRIYPGRRDRTGLQAAGGEELRNCG